MESFHSILGVVPRGGLCSRGTRKIVLNASQLMCILKRVYGGAKTCEEFLCFVAIVRVRVYYVDFFVFFVLRHW